MAVPEPSTWAMMVLGFAGLGFAGYRKARKAASIGLKRGHTTEKGRLAGGLFACSLFPSRRRPARRTTAQRRTPAPPGRRRIRIPSPPAQGANFPPPRAASRSTWRRQPSRRALRSSPPCRSPWRGRRRLRRRTALAPSRTPAPGSRPSRDARPRRSPFPPRRAMRTAHRAAPDRARARVRIRPPALPRRRAAQPDRRPPKG